MYLSMHDDINSNPIGFDEHAGGGAICIVILGKPRGDEQVAEFKCPVPALSLFRATSGEQPGQAVLSLMDPGILRTSYLKL
jgi:hypothetical protein